ncbi:MAG: peptidyl-prolyl cis-trans isomerase [Proteobacteria bacterium]|jgi:peptidyl-prolyl cis-trans isomerase B (cyclophilin B)|nr:peptidyl-prolyl cis-trans isomerase [Pseudomonadota bacterium]
MKIVLNTTLGAVELELNEEKAPLTVKNFANYVKSGHYDGTIFHRVINNFMIQGGGFDEKMQQKPTQDEIKNEANNGLKNEKYTIAMARTMAPHSASSQFFINVKNNEFLDFRSEDSHGWGYAVFGKVTSGMDIVDKICLVKTGNKKGHDDVPNENIVINTATIV